MNSLEMVGVAAVILIVAALKLWLKLNGKENTKNEN